MSLSYHFQATKNGKVLVEGLLAPLQPLNDMQCWTDLSAPSAPTQDTPSMAASLA